MRCLNAVPRAGLATLLLVRVFSPVPLLADAEPMTMEIAGKDGAPMALVPAGEFLMGSNDGASDERPVHRVYVDAYYIDKFEITTSRYLKFLQSTG